MPVIDPATDPATAERYAKESEKAPHKQMATLAMELGVVLERGDMAAADVLLKKIEALRHDGEDGLPDMVYGDVIQSTAPVLPEELIAGILHRGAKMVLGGGSKSFKTWCLLDLAVSISQGVPWWGRETKKGVVVYLNFEVQKGFFHKRILDVAKAKGLVLGRDFIVWNLRGHSTDHSVLLPKLAARLQGLNVAAIILDPAYKIMSGNENEQASVALLMNSIERLGEQVGASTIFGAHFSKGDQSIKEAIDRISGSGVFARDPDAILPMTRHEEDGTFAIEPILRNCPPVDAFCVRWNFPLMEPADDADPAALRSVQKTQKAKANMVSPKDILRIVREMNGRVEGRRHFEALVMEDFKVSAPVAKASIEAALGVTIQYVSEARTGTGKGAAGGKPLQIFIPKEAPESAV